MPPRQANPWNEERRLVLDALDQLRKSYDALSKSVTENQLRTESKLDEMANGHDRKLERAETEINTLKATFGERIRAVEVRSGIYAALALGLSLLAKATILH